MRPAPLLALVGLAFSGLGWPSAAAAPASSSSDDPARRLVAGWLGETPLMADLESLTDEK